MDARIGMLLSGLVFAMTGVTSAVAVPIYLNNTNSTVAVGPNTSVGSFNNTFSGGNTIEKAMDAPSATATEFHNQSTHIWFTAANIGGGLELLIDFGQEYDINTLHFWNYTGESFDVDNINFTFFNNANAQVGALSLMPALGSSPGILAEDLVLPAPLNVQFVTAFLTGDNGQVDFQNLGFTGDVSPVQTPPPAPPPPVQGVPEPNVLVLFGTALLGLAAVRRRRR